MTTNDPRNEAAEGLAAIADSIADMEPEPMAPYDGSTPPADTYLRLDWSERLQGVDYDSREERRSLVYEAGLPLRERAEDDEDEEPACYACFHGLWCNEHDEDEDDSPRSSRGPEF